MSNTAHTPGPWVINDLYAETEIRGPENSGAMICVMTPWGIAADEPSPQHANARLIAAAPQLLEALQAVMKSIGRGSPSTVNAAEAQLAEAVAAGALARAAIAKATGGAA